MFNAFKYHPEDLDPCLASELQCDAEPSFPQWGSGPAVGARVGCWPGDGILGLGSSCCLRKPKTALSWSVMGYRREEGSAGATFWCYPRCQGSKPVQVGAMDLESVCVTDPASGKVSGLNYQGQCLDMANISRCPKLGRLLLGIEAFCTAFWADSLWCLSPSSGDLSHPAQDSFLILRGCDMSHQGLFQLWAKENIWLLPLFVSVVSLCRSCLQPGATWIPITRLPSILLSL